MLFLYLKILFISLVFYNKNNSNGLLFISIMNENELIKNEFYNLLFVLPAKQ